MIRFCRHNKDSVITNMLNGNIDAVHSSTTNLADEIILAMHKNDVLKCLTQAIPDKRADNTTIPFDLVMALATTAKMKIKTSLSDIPFAITDHRVISELGYTLYDTKGNLDKGLMCESSLRSIIGKYSSLDFFNSYNNAVQKYISQKLNISPDIHILDCTKLEVNFKNQNYEGAKISIDNEGNKARGYKLATLRGITGDTGIIEDIRFGAMDIHDLELSRDILYNSPVLKRGDIITNDRGFISREVMNYLKNKRGVDTYIPLKTNMITFEMAVSTAKLENKWSSHPNKKRKNQKIAFVSDLGQYWESENHEDDVDINACVVWDSITDEYFVFITTDLTKSAKQIIKTYELRPEIEEDFRQIKDFWKIEDFKSTKLNFIAFHIVCTLFGYLFFQLYTMLPEGEIYAHKSLPIILKNYTPTALNYLVFYSGSDFAVLSLIEFAELYSLCSETAIRKLTLLMTDNFNHF